MISTPESLIDLYGRPTLDTPNVVRFEGMQWMLGLTAGTPAAESTDETPVPHLDEIDGWINSRCGEVWGTDGWLSAAFHTPLAPGEHIVATFTLGVAPRPGVYKARFSTGTSITQTGEWATLQNMPLTITVQAP